MRPENKVGSVRAALAIIDGFNLYGKSGAAWSVINVDQDALCRNQRTLEALLPRQSNSKFTDAALLPTLSWSCFAANLTSQKAQDSLERITDHLERSKGLIRFQKDGFRTHIEDRTRCHYLPAELKKFDGIESEWPVFFGYLLIDAKFRGNDQLVSQYRDKLNATLVDNVCPTYFQIVEKKKNPIYLSNMHWVQVGVFFHDKKITVLNSNE